MIKKQITAFDRNTLREEKYYIQSTLSGLQTQISNITVSGTENAYYKDSATQEAFVNGSAANITLGNLNTLNSNTRPFNGFGSTVLDTDGNLAASTVPNDALFMSKWGYNAYPRRYSVPGIKTLIGTYTLQASGLICEYVWYVAPSNTIYFQEQNSLEAHYPVYVKNNHRYWIFTALVRGQDDGIDVNIYNQDDDLIATENFLFNADEWTQITFSFDINPTGARKLVASITPFSAVQVAAIAMYPTDSLTLSQETPPFAPSIDLYDSIGTNDIIDESIITGKIADDAVGANQIQADTITTYHLASSVEDRIFTASGFRNTVEQVIPNSPLTPRVNDDMVYEGSIRTGAVSRVKESFIDGSLLGNLFPERWSWRHEDPYVVNYSGGASNWMSLNSPSYSGWFNRHNGYRLIQNTTPAASGQTRVYFGTSDTDYNITLYPKNYFDATLYPQDEFTYINLTATTLCNATMVSAKPIFGIKLANGTNITFSGYSYQFGTTVRTVADYFDVSAWITAPTSGILYLEQNTKPTLSRNFIISDIQLFYSAKLPIEFYGDGANLYTPNQYQSITVDYIHPSAGILGTQLASGTIASGQLAATAVNPNKMPPALTKGIIFQANGLTASTPVVPAVITSVASEGSAGAAKNPLYYATYYLKNESYRPTHIWVPPFQYSNASATVTGIFQVYVSGTATTVRTADFEAVGTGYSTSPSYYFSITGMTGDEHLYIVWAAAAKSGTATKPTFKNLSAWYVYSGVNGV